MEDGMNAATHNEIVDFLMANPERIGPEIMDDIMSKWPELTIGEFKAAAADVAGRLMERVAENTTKTTAVEDYIASRS
jgi:hypothetical protein